MKENWERTELPADLSIEEIEELVRPAADGRRVLSAARLGEGFSNTNYKLQLEGGHGPYVLRLYRRDSSVAEKELEIARRLHGKVPVPNMIHMDASCTRYKSPWALMEWKEGILLRDVLKSGDSQQRVQAAAEALGKVLADIHAHTFPTAGFLGKSLEVAEPFAMEAEAFLIFMKDSLFANRSGYWLGEELAPSLWTFCQKHAHKLSDPEDIPVLVHSDFNGLNILIAQDGGVSAVLDWEFAFAGSRLTDIANLLRYEQKASPFERQFIRSYEQHTGKALPGEWQLRSKLEDLIALCDMLNHSTEATPNRVLDLKRLIRRTLEYSADA